MGTDMFLAVAILIIVIGSEIGTTIIRRRERALDTSTAQGMERQRMLRIARYVIHAHTLIITLILWLVVRPLIAH